MESSRSWTPYPPPPRWGCLVTCLTPTFLQRQDGTLQLNWYFIIKGGGRGREGLAGLSWEVILESLLKIPKSALHEWCHLWQVLCLLLVSAVRQCRVSKQKNRQILSSIVEYWKILLVNYDNVQKSAYVRSLETRRLEKTLHWIKANWNPFRSYC